MKRQNVRSPGTARRALLALAAFLTSLPACSQEPRALTSAEQELLREVGFDNPTVVASIAAVGGPVHRLMALSDEGDAVPAGGVTVELRENRVAGELARLRAELGPLGFGVYQAEQNFGFEPDRLAIVSGTDPYAFLELVRVDGINYDLEHEAVVATLREWDNRYGLDYLGAGLDWVNARFRTPPSDMAAFAREVYAFCPDVVDQGTETVERLADEMRRSGTLYCWWD